MAQPPYNDPLLLDHPPSPTPGASYSQSYSPEPQFLGRYQDPSARDSTSGSEYASSLHAMNNNHLLSNDNRYRDEPQSSMPMSPMGGSRYLEEKATTYAPPRSKRKPKIILAVGVLLLIIIAAIVVVYFTVIKKSNSTDAGGRSATDRPQGEQGNSNSDGVKPPAVAAAVTGGDGSEVTFEDGTKQRYTNPHGGYWYYDVNDPFNNRARAQSWSPALNETFNHNTNRIRGVNLGGWFTIEPFIVPELFERYHHLATPPVDEYTLHTVMAADTANGGLNQIEEHYKTFITEEDFMMIAAAGLNYLRIPVPFWFVDTLPSEPFLPKVGWKYFVKALGWARKYGLRVKLDLHAAPGSQNGWNHSGRLGEVNMLRGPMGLANAQRTLDIIRILAEFVSQPQYRDVVTMFGILNEARGGLMGKEQLFAFYEQAYRVVREATGLGKGPQVSFHDGFYARSDYVGFMPNADRVVLDSHPYTAFGGQSDEGWGTRTGVPCGWGRDQNASSAAFGLSINGEFSNAINDCGKWVNGVDQGHRYEGGFIFESTPRIGDCSRWTDWTRFTDQTKAELKNFAMASMDGLYNYFFWTWKIGDSIVSKRVEAPAWSYKLGLEQGWMPKDSREADGFCQNASPFLGTITFGTGNNYVAQYPWPPASILEGGPAARLPSYTATGAIPTLTGGTLTVSGLKPTKTVDVGNGWNNPNDNAGAMAPIAGCNYLDPYVGISAAAPVPLCNGVGVVRKRASLEPTPTPSS